LDNSDKYHKIVVVDPDEIILPRTKMPSIQTSKDSINFTSSINENTSLMNFDSLCTFNNGENNKTDIQLFVENIQNNIKNAKNSSIGFFMLSFLRYNTFEELMKKTEDFLATLDEKGRTNFVGTSLNFASYRSPKFNKYTDIWNISINGIKELKYAEGLLFLYKNYVKPFMDELNHEIQYPGDIYYRFQYFLSNILHYYVILVY
jgi:hypothetical protein